MLIHKNIRYAKPERCLLDVYSQDLAYTKRPVVIVIHGGAWFLGDKSIAKEIAEHLVANGFTVVAPCYRLSNISDQHINSLMCFESILLILLAISSNGHDSVIISMILILFTLLIIAYAISKPRHIILHPVHANDVADVVSWTNANIEDFCGDPNRLFLMGHSAGGHLASIVSCNPKYLRRVNLEQNIIKGTICICGVFSDKRINQSKIGQELLKNTFGKRPSYMDAFPIYHCQPNTPPHFLINANIDYSLKRHTFDLFFALREQGVYVKTKVYPDTNHFNIRRFWDSKNMAVLLDIKQFILEVIEYLEFQM